MTVAADAPATGPVWPELSWPGTQVRRLQAANGQRYTVTVWLPEGEPPAGGFPALYVLDANALFGTVVEAVRRSSRRVDATGIGAAAVIGIAHEGDELFADAARRRDYTSGPARQAPPPSRSAGAEGGALAFLAFIADELLPQLQRELPLNPAQQTLFGHSLAGYFVLQALAARPQLFGHWAAISPSIWWDEPGLRAALQATLAPKAAGAANPSAATDAGPRLFLAVGEWEEAVPPWQRQHPGYEQLVARRAQRRMVASARELATELSGWLGEGRVVFREFPEEDHASILMIAVQRVLRFAFA